MRLTENRKLGAIVCALCVLISIFGFGGIKLSKRQDSLESTFIYGTETKLAVRHSMDEYLDRCAQCASDLASEAERYITDSELIGSVKELSGKLSAKDGMEDRYDIYVNLSRAVEDTYTELQKANASDEVNVSVAYHDYLSAQNLLKNDGYHAVASEYNKDVGAFPASVIAPLWGVQKADTYGW